MGSQYTYWSTCEDNVRQRSMVHSNLVLYPFFNKHFKDKVLKASHRLKNKKKNTNSEVVLCHVIFKIPVFPFSGALHENENWWK